jgi:cobalt/nickel transport system ATP-binding protein
VGLALQGVRYAYPDGRVALDGVELEVATGERVAVLGPNGAGKTTLVLHLNGVLAPQAGRVLVDGLDTSAKSDVREVRRRVGIVFQDPDDQLFCPTVRQDVGFGPANLGLGADEVEARVLEALDVVGMAGAVDRAPHHLSLGERRRVAVATVLAMRPTTLVLDEPSANLDPAARGELAAVLRDLPELTLVVVTHDLPYALELCSRSVVLDGGHIVDDGATVDLLADPERLAAHRLALPPGLRLA